MLANKISLLFFVFIFLFSFCYADFEVGNLSHSLDASYASGQSVRGWVNLSFSNELANSSFTDSEGNSVSLISLLKTNPDFDYSCSPLDCASNYNAEVGVSEKSFSLRNKDSKLIGFKIVGDKIDINSVDFVVSSNAGESCLNQLEIDFFNDGVFDLGNNKSSLEECSFLKSYGCFDDSRSLSEFSISSSLDNKHCQRITLSESPGFKIGAWVERGDDTRDLFMAVYNTGGEEKKSCQLPDSSGEVFCDVDFLVTESGDYYVCIFSKTEGDDKVRGYADEEKGCGFYGGGIQKEVASFQIFAEGKKFDSVGDLEISNSLMNKNTVAGIFQDYISSVYGSFDCSGGCVVPMRIVANKDQDVVLKNLRMSYGTSLGPTTEVNFYELSEVSSKINADFQKLYLDEGNFILSGSGEEEYKMKFVDKEIFSESLFIGDVPEVSGLFPLKTASAFPTLFKVVVNSSDSIIEYEWDFGNNDIKVTSVNEVEYIYPSIGEYQVKVTVKDVSQKVSSAVFNVVVESPKGLIDKTLGKMKSDFVRVSEQLKGFDVALRNELESSLGWGSIEEKLNQFQRDFTSAGSTEEYNRILTNLISLRIPESVVLSKTGKNISFIMSKSNVDMSILKLIGGGDYEFLDEDKYLDAISGWNQENMDVKIDFEQVSARYESGDEPLLYVFDFYLKRKTDFDYTPYFVMKSLEGLNFKENYLEKEESGYFYIDLVEHDKKISFSVSEDVSFDSLPVFISPSLSRLVVISGETPPEEKAFFRVVIFVLLLLLLFIFALIAYIILQEWYKRKYETYLFKNRNYLFNLISYIGNSKKKNLSDSEIEEALKKAGWNSEQVTYAMRKYFGKRTGMFEIPVDKLLDKFRKKKEVKVVTKPPVRDKFYVR